MRTAIYAYIVAAMLCCPLALAAPASAACAWVLWGQYKRSSDFKDEYFPAEAFESKVECDLAERRNSDAEQQRAQKQPGKYSLGAASFVFFQCFPDAVDPRGPKGK